MNINSNTYPSERQFVIDKFKEQLFVTWVQEQVNTIDGRRKYLEDIKGHEFVLCPRGNGIDTQIMGNTLYGTHTHCYLLTCSQKSVRLTHFIYK